MSALQSGLQFWKEPKVAQGQIWRIWWMVQFQYRFFGLPDNERVMSRGTVTMQDPSIRPKLGSSPTNSLMSPCQYFQITMLLVHCSTYHSFFRRDENTRLCSTATASLLLPHLLHQHMRRNHRHVTRRCSVIATSLFDAT
jgi:hypothetical protein